VSDKTSGRYTTGDIEINRKQMLPIKNLKITIDNIETVEPSNRLTTSAVSRVGIIGEDYTKYEPDNNSDTHETPFISYVKHKVFDGDNSFDKVIFDQDFNVEKGLAGFYVEVGLSYFSIKSPMRKIYAGAYSQTFFFEDLLYGSWERNGETNIFTKSVVKRIKSIETDSYVYLTFEAEIE